MEKGRGDGDGGCRCCCCCRGTRREAEGAGERAERESRVGAALLGNKKERGGASYCSAGKLQPALLIGLNRALNKQRSPKGARQWVGTALGEQLGAGVQEPRRPLAEAKGLEMNVAGLSAPICLSAASEPQVRPRRER